MINSHIIFRNKDLQSVFDNLEVVYLHDITDKYRILYMNFVIRLKLYSKDESSIILVILHWLLLIWKIKIDNPLISDYFREKLKILKKSHRYQMDWDRKAYLESIFEMDRELFLVKMIVKLTILSYWKEYLNLIENKKNYYRFAWLLIPYLKLRESKFSGFFQDIYFKNLFPWKYKKTQYFYYKKFNQLELPWEHLMSILNNLTDTMSDTSITWKIKVRRKTYFSIYNKMKIKNGDEIFDIIWVRIIFNSIGDLKKFDEIFEQKYVIIKKKDYILHPKNNWYESIHYRFLSLYWDANIMVELQIRTDKMNRDIHWNREISHFSYTLNNDKWSKEFEDVNFGMEYLNKYIEKKNVEEELT